MNKLIVLIPHYNCPLELKATLASVSEDFPIDILIVDDGSHTKPELTELKDIYRNEGQIFIEELIKNQGIEKALNHGLRFIHDKEYQYIGRLDAGDKAHPNKFSKQIAYLDNNPDTYLLGTWGNIVDEAGSHLYFLKHPTQYEEIKKRMYFNSCFIHPTVIFRKEVINTVGFYPENRKSAEDFAYFFNIIKKHKVENLPEVLLDYVISDKSISTQKRKQQIRSRIKVIKDNFYLGFYPIVGIIRNTILLFTSRDLIIRIKLFLGIEK